MSAAAGLPGSGGGARRVSRIFYKTELCSFYQANCCTRGVQCQFAHSPAELRRAPDLSCTRLCPSLVHSSHCEDPQCRFAHDISQLRRIEPVRKLQGPRPKCRQQLGTDYGITDHSGLRDTLQVRRDPCAAQPPGGPSTWPPQDPEVMDLRKRAIGCIREFLNMDTPTPGAGSSGSVQAASSEHNSPGLAASSSPDMHHPFQEWTKGPIYPGREGEFPASEGTAASTTWPSDAHASFGSSLSAHGREDYVYDSGEAGLSMSRLSWPEGRLSWPEGRHSASSYAEVTSWQQADTCIEPESRGTAPERAPLSKPHPPFHFSEGETMESPVGDVELDEREPAERQRADPSKSIRHGKQPCVWTSSGGDERNDTSPVVVRNTFVTVEDARGPRGRRRASSLPPGFAE